MQTKSAEIHIRDRKKERKKGWMDGWIEDRGNKKDKVKKEQE